MCLTCEEWNTPTTAKVVQDVVACRRGWRPASPVPRNCAAPQQHGHMGDGEKEVFNCLLHISTLFAVRTVQQGITVTNIYHTTIGRAIGVRMFNHPLYELKPYSV